MDYRKVLKSRPQRGFDFDALRYKSNLSEVKTPLKEGILTSIFDGTVTCQSTKRSKTNATSQMTPEVKKYDFLNIGI